MPNNVVFICVGFFIKVIKHLKMTTKGVRKLNIFKGHC